jgi:hypothetical protein
MVAYASVTDVWGIKVNRRRGFMLTHLTTRFDRGAESLEASSSCVGVGAKVTENTFRASSFDSAEAAASLNLDIRRR